MSKQMNISDLQPDNNNFNKHTEFGMSLLEKSVRKFGMGRSILIDKNNKIIAGNGITETAANVGIENVRVIETDGNEIIAVKRNDIDLDTEEGKEMALADNATNAANLAWDYKALKEEGVDALSWGINIDNAINQFHKEVEEYKEATQFPITILQDETEYLMFRQIADYLNLNNMDTFNEIMKFYIKNNKL